MKKINQEKENVVFNVINILILVVNIYYKGEIELGIWLLVSVQIYNFRKIIKIN